MDNLRPLIHFWGMSQTPMDATPPLVRFADRSTPPHIMTLVAMAGMTALTMNVFLPSLPTMAVHFGTDYATMQLAVSVYLAVNALLTVLIGPISDRFGRRPVVLVCSALFLLATLGCLWAPTIETFLLFRAGQAVIASGIVVSRAVVRDMHPADKAASVIGYVTMGMAVIPMVGPIIGGALDQVFGWQANFWLLTICGTAFLALTWTDLGETAAKQSGGLADQIKEYPALLTSPRFWGYCMSVAFASGAFFAYLGGAPLIATDEFGLSPAVMGIYFGAPAVGYAVGNYLTGRFSAQLGINFMVFWGAVINLGGLLACMAFYASGVQTELVFFGFMVFVGLGNGLVLPNGTAGMLSVRPQLAGSASGLGAAMMIGGGAALSAIASAVLIPGWGAYPLLALQIATALASLGCILLVIWRERHLATKDPSTKV